MPRRPEIGNVQLYPNRPLKKSDKNGYVLKFYCPLQGKRIRRNCGTRDRREARRVLRECRERLLNGQYVASGGAITAEHEAATAKPALAFSGDSGSGKSWQECYERYREHRKTRIRESSLVHALSRLNIAERIFEGYRQDHGLSEGLLVSEVMTLDMLEYLQDRLLAGDECRYDSRSPNTVNGMMGAVMSFVRFCHRRDWIPSVPPLAKLDTAEVMHGRPISQEEFDLMVKSTTSVVGEKAAASWIFVLRILWESGFRLGDLMDFSWDDDRRIHPVWSRIPGQYPTIVIPSTQKNRRVQEIPLLPGLNELLQSVPKRRRRGWIANPVPISCPLENGKRPFRPIRSDLQDLIEKYSNCAIADACEVTEAAVRKWLLDDRLVRAAELHNRRIVPRDSIEVMRERSLQLDDAAHLSSPRLSTDYMSRVIASIGKAAGIVVHRVETRSGVRVKFASAHDLRRGCAQRLINAGVSAESLKVIMRHASFATTEKHYGAIRSAQSAAEEVSQRLAVGQESGICGGINGGNPSDTQLSPEDVLKVKSLLNML